MKLWADILLTAWILFVGFVYFGGALIPAVGARTWQLGAVYVIMLVISCAYALSRTAAKPPAQDDDTR